MTNFERIKSDKIEMYGVKWYISSCSVSCETDGEDYIDVYLIAKHNFERK